MASAQKSLRHVLYRGRVLAVRNGFQRRSINTKQFAEYWNTASSSTKVAFGSVSLGVAVYFGSNWALDRINYHIDYNYKQTTGTRLALEAHEEYEQLKYQKNQTVQEIITLGGQQDMKKEYKRIIDGLEK